MLFWLQYEDFMQRKCFALPDMRYNSVIIGIFKSLLDNILYPPTGTKIRSEDSNESLWRNRVRLYEALLDIDPLKNKFIENIGSHPPPVFKIGAEIPQVFWDKRYRDLVYNISEEGARLWRQKAEEEPHLLYLYCIDQILYLNYPYLKWVDDAKALLDVSKNLAKELRKQIKEATKWQEKIDLSDANHLAGQAIGMSYFPQEEFRLVEAARELQENIDYFKRIIVPKKMKIYFTQNILHIYTLKLRNDTEICYKVENKLLDLISKGFCREELSTKGQKYLEHSTNPFAVKLRSLPNRGDMNADLCDAIDELAKREEKITPKSLMKVLAVMDSDLFWECYKPHRTYKHFYRVFNHDPTIEWLAEFLRDFAKYYGLESYIQNDTKSAYHKIDNLFDEYYKQTKEDKRIQEAEFKELGLEMRDGKVQYKSKSV